MKKVKIKGVGSYIPSRIVTNDDLSELVETNHQWIIERTGICERRISEGEDTSSIAYKSAIAALSSSNIEGNELDLIIVATITPDSFTPSVACILQKKLGAINATAFDINAACTGFIYALEVGESLLKTGRYKNALIVGAETLSKIVDWKDRSTCVLFGDGGGAAVIKASEDDASGIINTYSISEGDKGDALTAEANSVINPFVKEEKIKDQYIKMNGREVFKFATKAMVTSINKVLENTGYILDDVDYIIPHQANLRIIDYAARKLNLESEKFYTNLNKVGNTSSASVPIALADLNKEGKLKAGDLIVLVAFGGGLTCGATLIKW
ncbi:beta-ketoacyl-ACP synthase III [Eubacterium multiforme]|uniref:Beta-ketoacyl-[acyl-carrier-protein] synthase III n=1 Tax=Eubacterium multiforme TaxID=83339 RepID=A0ABT9UND3_9FIRM|nr:beta-ketoacyl-ACP synthase III [Eubacterium multiforme]MDQ0148152.1 3-oxoacyl-[acyl-carrier-protein] synthase-3 [Eubacterium multiforme]